MVLGAGKNTTKLNYVNPNIVPAINPPQSSKNFGMDCICAPPRAHMHPAGRTCAPWVHLGCICAPRRKYSKCAPHVRPVCAPPGRICAPRDAYTSSRVSFLEARGSVAGGVSSFYVYSSPIKFPIHQNNTTPRYTTF